MKLDTEKLREALAQPKTAVHCDTEEKAEALFEAMGWSEDRGVCRGGYRYEIHGGETCFVMHGKNFLFGCLDFCEKEGYAILPLDDFILPDKPRLAEVLGVEVGQEFAFDMDEYRENTYRVNENGERELRINSLSGSWLKPNSDTALADMINNPHLIRIIPKWSADDVADAEAVLRILPKYEWVARDENGEVCVYRHKPNRIEENKIFGYGGDHHELPRTAFPSVTWENDPVRVADISTAQQ